MLDLQITYVILQCLKLKIMKEKLEKSKIYFKQLVKNGYRYGSYCPGQASDFIDLLDVRLDFNTRHYFFTPKVDRIDPSYDDLIEITFEEFDQVQHLFKLYDSFKSMIDKSFIKLNYVY